MHRSKFYFHYLFLGFCSALILFINTSFTYTNSNKIIVKITYDTTNYNKYNDTILYKPATFINWSDFKAKPIIQQDDDEVANSSIGFSYNATINTDTKKNSTILIKIKAYFIRSKSWVLQNSKTNYILQHEQKHFDIARYGAELLMQKLIKHKITATNINDMLSSCFSNSWNAYLQLQHDYDDETNHSINKDQQIKWNKKIEKLLQQINY